MNTQILTTETDDRNARLHDAYARKVSNAVAADRDDLVREFAQAYAAETGQLGTTPPGHLLERRSGRRAPRPGSWTARAGESLRRFDRYTLEVMNPGHPYRRGTDRSA